MFRSVVFKRAGFSSSRLTSLKSVGKPLSQPRFNNPLIGISAVRFQSTGVPENASEITTQLPSFVSDVGDGAAKLTSDTIGYLESVGLPGNWFMGIFEHSLEYIHVYTGLPWWVSIILATVAFRASLFPLSIKVSENMAKNAKAKPELDAIKAQISNPENTMAQKQMYQQKLFATMKKYGIKHRYAIAPLAQVATSIGLFVSIREMCLLPVDGFTEQGAYWFTDLSATDPYAALPIVSALIYAGSIKRGGEMGEYSMPSTFKKFMIFMPIVSIPFTMQLSAGVSLYLTTSALFSAFQMFMFSNKTTRKFLGLSEIVKPLVDKSAPKESIKDTINNFAEKMRTDAEAKAKTIDSVSEAHNIAMQQRGSSSKAVIRKRRSRK